MIKIVFLIICIVIVIVVRYSKSTAKNKKLYEIPKSIKNTYKKISIPSDRIDIQTRGYYEAETSDSYMATKIGALDSLVNKNDEHKVYKEVSVLSYNEFQIKGNQVLLRSNPLYMPGSVLKQKLTNQKQIDIYIDEKNINSVYYDLSFLQA